MELQRQTSLNLNLTAETQVLNYVYTGSDPIEVITRVDLGDLSKPIQGGGTYLLNVYVNGVIVLPASPVVVPGGQVRAIMASRPVAVYSGDTITVKVAGLGGDTAVDVLATLRTATPLQKTDVFGTGPTAVDHNYGGTNNLAYQAVGGAGVVGASVVVYLTSDYNAGNRGQGFVQARTVTVAGGAWLQPLYLNPGSTPNNYTIVCSLPGAYGPDVRAITV